MSRLIITLRVSSVQSITEWIRKYLTIDICKAVADIEEDLRLLFRFALDRLVLVHLRRLNACHHLLFGDEMVDALKKT